MTTKVDKVESQMEEVRKDLKKLRKDFLEMMLEQRRTAALEQATTELVSVRSTFVPIAAILRSIRTVSTPESLICTTFQFALFRSSNSFKRVSARHLLY